MTNGSGRGLVFALYSTSIRSIERDSLFSRIIFLVTFSCVYCFFEISLTLFYMTLFMYYYLLLFKYYFMYNIVYH